MWILPLIGYIGIILGFGFLTLAIGVFASSTIKIMLKTPTWEDLAHALLTITWIELASGLYYLSELVEEHTVIAKKLLTNLIYAVIVIQVLLVLIDGFPWTLSALSIVSHVVYMQNLRRFPIVKLTDVVFLLSCVLVLLNHYVWFRHFSEPSPYSPPSSSYPYRHISDQQSQSYQQLATFTEVASYFGLCVWLVPFSLFISLSASENVLPSMGSEYATGEGSSYIRAGKVPNGMGKGGNAGMAKALVGSVRSWVSETVEMTGFRRGERKRNAF